MQIKQAVQEKEGIQVDQIKLIFAGKQLADDKTIASYNITAGSTIHIVLQLEREKMVEEVNNSRRLDWDQANEKKINEICGIKGDLLKASLFTCGRCKSTKTTSTQKQTRLADEPMTVFVLCMNCGNRWKC